MPLILTIGDSTLAMMFRDLGYVEPTEAQIRELDQDPVFKEKFLEIIGGGIRVALDDDEACADIHETLDPFVKAVGVELQDPDAYEDEDDSDLEYDSDIVTEEYDSDIVTEEDDEDEV